MIRQERKIYWFSRFFSNFNLFSSVFKMAIERNRFAKYSRDNVTFEREFKTI